MMPKSTCDVRKIEFARMWRLTQTTIEPISFTVPRAKVRRLDDDHVGSKSATLMPRLDCRCMYRQGSFAAFMCLKFSQSKPHIAMSVKRLFHDIAPPVVKCKLTPFLQWPGMNYSITREKGLFAFKSKGW